LQYIAEYFIKMSENIIVALHSQPPSSPSEYLGAEVTMVRSE
jgi:hypothetical protein